MGGGGGGGLRYLNYLSFKKGALDAAAALKGV